MSQTVPVQRNSKITLEPIGHALMPMSYFAKETRSWFYSLGSYITLILFGMIGYVHLLFIWYFIDYYQEGAAMFVKSPFLLLSRFEGQMALLLFSIEFILAVRSKLIEKLFGGFDRVYKMHSMLGRIGFFMAILHFLLLFVDAWEYKMELILPSSSLATLYGQLALWLFIVLIAITVWIKLPHHIWIWTHKALGIAFLFSGFHMFLTQSLYKEFEPYRTFLAVIWFLAVYAWLYKIFLYNFSAPSHRATVTKVIQKHNIVDLYLKIEGNKFSSRPGDFVWISLTKSRRNLLKEHHPFSISGLFEDNTIRLSIKDLGDFSHNISQLQSGDTVTVYGPYGKFDDKLFSKRNNMVWIGGGIGIAPFLYMAQQFANLPSSGTKGKRRVQLFYSVKSPDEILYLEELENAQKEDADFSYKTWVSEEQGFLTAKEILASVGDIKELKKRTIFICSSQAMMHAISKQLIELGVNPRNIIFEEFTFG
jgi:predicted ferric reductase